MVQTVRLKSLHLNSHPTAEPREAMLNKNNENNENNLNSHTQNNNVSQLDPGISPMFSIG
jgi:hypothetical protein